MVVGFERRTYTVGEDGGQVELCVNITVPRQQDIGTVTFNITVETKNGSAGISCNRSQNDSQQTVYVGTALTRIICNT